MNTVAPGLVLDEVLHAGDSAASPYVASMRKMYPLGGTGAPADIAGAALFLASDELLPWTTGAFVEVSGGSHTGRPHVPLSRRDVQGTSGGRPGVNRVWRGRSAVVLGDACLTAAHRKGPALPPCPHPDRCASGAGAGTDMQFCHRHYPSEFDVDASLGTLNEP